MLKHLSPRVNFHTYIRLFLLFLALSNGIRTINAFAQGFNTDFGQNRVQYHQFIWTSYESPNFTTYFYQGGQNLGRFVVFMAEQNLAELNKQLIALKSNEKNFSIELKNSKALDSYDVIVLELNKLSEQKGAKEEQLRLWVSSIGKVSDLKKRLEKWCIISMRKILKLKI